jgi:hypothetical protein
MYEQNSLQMEWCLNCHRNPAANIRPTSEIYNMAWAGASNDRPVWCAPTGKGGATAQNVTCTTTDPKSANPTIAMLQIGPGTSKGEPAPQKGSGTRLQPVPLTAEGMTVSDVPGSLVMPAQYQEFKSQGDLGRYLMAQYHIRTANELASCEVCHR